MSILVAYTKDGERIHISEWEDKYKGLLTCAEGHVVVAKKGTKKVHHFAHAKDSDASNCTCLYGDGKGEWHRKMQDRIIPKCLEVRLSAKDSSRVIHIADALCDGRRVIEFQHSPMSQTEMAKREAFYTGEHGFDMCWVFDIAKRMDLVPIGTQIGDIICFQWRSGPKYPLDAGVKTYLDTGTSMDLLEVMATNKNKTKVACRIKRMGEFDAEWIGEHNLTKGADGDRDHLPYRHRDKILPQQEAMTVSKKMVT